MLKQLNILILLMAGLGIAQVHAAVDSEVITATEFEFPSRPLDFLKEEGINTIKYIVITDRNYVDKIDHAIIAEYDKNNKTYMVYQAAIPHEKKQLIDDLDNAYASSPELFNRFKDKYIYLVGNVTGLKNLRK